MISADPDMLQLDHKTQFTPLKEQSISVDGQMEDQHEQDILSEQSVVQDEGRHSGRSGVSEGWGRSGLSY